MADRKRHLIAGYAGVYYRESLRPGGLGSEKVYYIRYRKNGRQIEEKAGAQHRDRMTPAKAQRMRALRIEGREPANAEKRKIVADATGSVDEAWRIFAAAKAGNRSFRDDQARYRLYIAPLLAAKPIEALGADDIDNLKASVAASGKAPQTVNHVLILLKRILNLALRRGIIASLPLAVRNARAAKVDNLRTENLTQNQLDKLLRALEEEGNQTNASIVRLALFTGMRKSAILNLKWADLDFERGFITLRGEVAKKGRTEAIPMNDMARSVLLAIPRASEYVFPGPGGQKPIANISSMLRRVRSKAGLPPDFRPLHGLRHSFASWLASSGKVSMYELQKLLTHSSPQMTQRYAHLHDDALKRASQLAGELFGGQKQETPAAD